MNNAASHAAPGSDAEAGNIFRAAPVALGLLRDGVLVEANDALCAITGYSREELLNHDIGLLYADDDEFGFADGKPADTPTGPVEMRWRRKDGSPLHILLNAAPVDGTEPSGGLALAVADLGEHKGIEGDLSRNQHFLNLILESIQDGISVLSPDLTVQHVNSVMKDWYRENVPLEGKKCHSVYHNSPVPCAPCPTLRCIQSGQTEKEELRGLPGASNEWYELYSYPMKEPGSDRIIGIVEFVRDISKRKKAENELIQKNALLSGLLNSISDLVFFKDLEGRYMGCNAEFAHSIGQSAEAITGRTCHDFFDSATAALFSNQDLEVLRSEQERRYETWIEYPNGMQILADVLKCPLRDESGRIIGLVGVSRDITERRHLEEERRRADQQMQQTQKLESLGVLAGGIAHDFNNILTAIQGHADLALFDLPTSSPIKESIQEIQRAAQRAGELCHQMLAYSGQTSFALQTLSINDVIEEMANLLRASISKKTVLQLHLEPFLPGVLADPSQIRQIVMNLIINASEAIGEDKGVITVSSGVMHCDDQYLKDTAMPEDLTPGNFVYLEVKDTGCGMDLETQRRLFEPFYTTKFAGRGLGMAAVRGIVSGHRGAIRISSEPGKGSIFTVLLPVTADSGLPLLQPAPHPLLASGLVLLVDDEKIIRTVCSRLLERLGFSVITAADGCEALELYRQHGPEIRVVLLDLTMPQKDGAETFSELLDINPDVTVIMASGYGREDILARFSSLGLAGVIQKPYSLVKLSETLAEVLDG